MQERFSDAELLDRACHRAAAVIRGMWEEKGSSDTRLLEEPLIPDRLVVAGRSTALKPSDRPRREHVVPRLVIVEECHRMLSKGASDTEIATLIRNTNRIVLITKEECEKLDRRDQLGLRQTMPKGWLIADDPYARLTAAGIRWDPISPASP